MSKELAVLGDVKELENIILKNDWIEKKCESLQEQNEQINQNIFIIKKLNSQLENLSAPPIMKINQEEMKKSIDTALNQVNSTFSTLPLESQAPNLKLPNFPLKLPLNEHILRRQENLTELQGKLEDLKGKSETIEKERKLIEKHRKAIEKSTLKMSKEIGSLHELLAVKKRKEAEQQLITAQHHLADLHQRITQKHLENQKIKEHRELLEQLFLRIDTHGLLDQPLLREMSAHDRQLQIELAEASAYFDTLPLIPHRTVSADDTIQDLQKLLKKVTRERRSVQRDIEVLKEDSDRMIVASEMLRRKVSGYEDVQRQIGENQKTLEEMAARRARELCARRMFEQAAGEVPGPRLGESLEPEDSEFAVVVNESGRTMLTSELADFFAPLPLLAPARGSFTDIMAVENDIDQSTWGEDD